MSSHSDCRKYTSRKLTTLMRLGTNLGLGVEIVVNNYVGVFIDPKSVYEVPISNRLADAP